jgi:hypothetical protein
MPSILLRGMRCGKRWSSNSNTSTCPVYSPKIFLFMKRKSKKQALPVTKNLRRGNGVPKRFLLAWLLLRACHFVLLPLCRTNGAEPLLRLTNDAGKRFLYFFSFSPPWLEGLVRFHGLATQNIQSECACSVHGDPDTSRTFSVKYIEYPPWQTQTWSLMQPLTHRVKSR